MLQIPVDLDYFKSIRELINSKFIDLHIGPQPISDEQYKLIDLRNELDRLWDKHTTKRTIIKCCKCDKENILHLHLVSNTEDSQGRWTGGVRCSQCCRFLRVNRRAY